MSRVQVVPQISQETFDAAVRENVEDFEMDPAEAVREAAQQFSSQGAARVCARHVYALAHAPPGVNLDNIIQAPPGEGAAADAAAPHPVVAALAEYVTLVGGDALDAGAAGTAAEALRGMLKERPVRLLAGNEGALPALLTGAERAVATAPAAAEAAIGALVALVHEQPDLLGKVQVSDVETAAGETAEVTPEIARLMAVVQRCEAPAHLTLALKACRHGCFMHESNRQAFVKAGLVEAALSAMEAHCDARALVSEAAMAIRGLTKDDDVRVPFGRGNEHAKLICTESRGLSRMLEVLKKTQALPEPDPAVTTELFRTLSMLTTRDEFCKELVELGVLDFVLPSLRNLGETESVAHTGCSLLRAVAGNDEVKRIIGERGGIALIVDTMQQQLRSEKVAEQGSAAIAALTLKTPANATLVAAAGGPHVIVKTMYMHPEAVKLQRQACMALRNIVVRNPELCDAVLGEGAESALNTALQKHARCKDEAKAALRDLGCKVELVERWKGAMKG